MSTPDERQGLPSASGFERLMLCPGSWQMEQGMPETPSEISERGEHIHAWLAGETVDLDNDAMEIADKCLLDRTEVTGREKDGDKIYIESRYWLDDKQKMLMSGKADYVLTREKEACIIDYKTGYGEVIGADKNPQLLALAVIIDHNFGPLDKITVAIVQPPHRPSVAVYDRDAINDAKTVIMRVLEASSKPEAKRIPGEKQCQYCKAKLKCPEAIGQLEVVASAPSQVIPQMDAKKLACLLDACEFADVIGDAVRKEAKKRLGAGVEVPGWSLKPGVRRESITDVSTLYQRMQNHGVTAQEFAGICTTTKKAVTEMVRNKTGLKGGALDVQLQWTLEGCTESKQAAPSLVREK